MTSIREFLNFVRNLKDNKNKVLSLGKIPEKLAIQLSEDSEIKIVNYEFVIDVYAVKHILRNHSNSDKERKRGQKNITDEDFELIPEIINNPDIVFYDGKNDLGRDTFQFQKKIDDKYVIIKEVRTGKKQLALNTMRVIQIKKNQEFSLDSL